MTKETELMETLSKINIGKDDILIKLRKDYLKIIKNQLTQNGWDKTFEYVTKERIFWSGDSSPLSRKCFHVFNTAYSKMWSLNKKQNAN